MSPGESPSLGEDRALRWQSGCKEPLESSLGEPNTFQSHHHQADGRVAPCPAGRLLRQLILGLHDSVLSLLPQFPAAAPPSPVHPGLVLFSQLLLGPGSHKPFLSAVFISCLPVTLVEPQVQQVPMGHCSCPKPIPLPLSLSLAPPVGFL